MGGDMTDLSDDPRSKVQAALVHAAADPDDDLGGHYRAACRAWYARLTQGEKWRVVTMLAAYERGAKADAEQLAAALPPALRFPLA
jgi:hypothetical protein